MMARLAGLTTALLLGGTTAWGAPPAEPPGSVLLPLDQELKAAQLAAVPSNDDLGREYPPIANRMGLQGKTVMTCKALTTGRLDECHVDSETPAGVGFGVAAVRTSVYFRVTPATRDGRPVDAKITIPMLWRTEHQKPVQDYTVGPVDPSALALGRQVVDLESPGSRMKADWRPFIEQQSAQLMASGDAKKTRALVTAFQQGLDDAVKESIDRQARLLAAKMSPEDLRAAAAFLRSPAGRRWAQANNDAYSLSVQDFNERVSTAARSHYCPDGACSATGSAAKAP